MRASTPAKISLQPWRPHPLNEIVTSVMERDKEGPVFFFPSLFSPPPPSASTPCPPFFFFDPQALKQLIDNAGRILARVPTIRRIERLEEE